MVWVLEWLPFSQGYPWRRSGVIRHANCGDEEDVLRIRFGPGVIRNDFSLKDVEPCHVVKTPWHYDWGIHLTLPGRLYNVSGYYAIEIKMKTGKKCRIGTDVPDDLETAI